MNKSTDYIKRINRTIDYIESNLNKQLTLDEIADIACFSKYHFHRIFHAFIGEPLYSFINRLRVEKIAGILLINRERSITEIVLNEGFNDSAVFARAFKKRFALSASNWIKKIKDHQNKLLKSNNFITEKQIAAKIKPISIDVRQLKKMTIAYVRHIGPFVGDGKLFNDLYKKLYKWALPRKLINYQATKQIILYHDAIEITEKEKLRITASITIPEKTEVDGNIGKMILPGGKYLLAKYELGEKDFTCAWGQIYRTILPENGYQPDDKACFELYCYGQNTKYNKKALVDICVPVKKL